MRISDWSSDVCSSDLKTRNSLIAFADPVISSGFRFQAERTLFGGLALLGITSPLKVEHAQLRYTSAVGYDLETRTTIDQTRSEARRVGKECVSTCRSRRSP